MTNSYIDRKTEKKSQKAKQSNREADWRKFRQFRNYVILKIRHSKSEFLNELDRKASDPNVLDRKIGGGWSGHS